MIKELKYQLFCFRVWRVHKIQNLIFWFWHQIPNSWLYWAVMQAWARGTTSAFTTHHPDEVTWSMMAKFLNGKKPK